MKTISTNKRVSFDYEIVDSLEVGIKLKGHEVKSLREGKINISDAVALFSGNEIFLHNLDIPLYSKAHPAVTHASSGTRKLLVHSYQAKRWLAKSMRANLRLVVLELYFNEKQLVKIKLGLGKRRKKAEKRTYIREKDHKKSLSNQLNNYR